MIIEEMMILENEKEALSIIYDKMDSTGGSEQYYFKIDEFKYFYTNKTFKILVGHEIIYSIDKRYTIKYSHYGIIGNGRNIKSQYYIEEGDCFNVYDGTNIGLISIKDDIDSILLSDDNIELYNEYKLHRIYGNSGIKIVKSTHPIAVRALGLLLTSIPESYDYIVNASDFDFGISDILGDS